MSQKLQSTKYPNLYISQGGIYYSRIMVAGKAVKKSLQTKNVNMALVKLAAELANAGSPVIAVDSLSWHAAITIYLNREHQRPELKPRAKDAIDFFASHAKKLTREDVPIKSISTDYCRGWWEKTAQTYAASTANGILNVIRGVFRVAMEMNAADKDPTAPLKRIPIRRGKLSIPSRKDFAAILQEVRRAASLQVKKDLTLESCPTINAIEFLAYSGCRIGEATKIQWKDIHDGLLYIPSNKHAREWRTLPINQALDDLLNRMRQQNEPKLSDYILTIQTPTVALRNACIRLDIPHVRVHDLRHYFATTAIESGVDIPTVAKWLGHRDGGALAMKVYGHLRDEHSREAAKKLRF